MNNSLDSFKLGFEYDKTLGEIKRELKRRKSVL